MTLDPSCCACCRASQEIATEHARARPNPARAWLLQRRPWHGCRCRFQPDPRKRCRCTWCRRVLAWAPRCKRPRCRQPAAWPDECARHHRAGWFGGGRLARPPRLR